MTAPATFEAPPSGEFVAGALLGKGMEVVALEGLAHQVLAHQSRAVESMHPVMQQASRYMLVFAGLSPNRFALHHRYHHAETSVPAQDLRGVIRHVLTSGTGGTYDVDPNDPNVIFPGFPLATDPLLKAEGGEVVFRNDPPLERFVGRGHVERFLPLAGVVSLLAVGNKLLGREKPLKKALSFSAGLLAGLTTQAVVTAAAEGMAGMEDGEFDLTSVPAPLRPRLARHQLHHHDPANLEAGAAARHTIGFRVLQRLRLVA